MDVTENKIEKMKAQIVILEHEISRLKSRLNMPTSPGWYWALAQGEPEPVVMQVIESDSHHGLKELICRRDGNIWGPVQKSDCIVKWLGPVAPCEYKEGHPDENP
jgi:hypothetical protein